MHYFLVNIDENQIVGPFLSYREMDTFRVSHEIENYDWFSSSQEDLDNEYIATLVKGIYIKISEVIKP